MSWLWIMLRYLFPGDPIRQGAEAIRQREVQLVDIANDDNWLQELLTDPAIRLQIELIILDAEDTLRLWIAMRGCQIARIRPGMPHERATPYLTRAKDLPELLARIYELLEACEKMEQRAQAHADRLKRLRDARSSGHDPHFVRPPPSCFACHLPRLCRGRTAPVLPRQRRGRWRDAQRRDGGGWPQRGRIAPHARTPTLDCRSQPVSNSQVPPARTRTRAQNPKPPGPTPAIAAEASWQGVIRSRWKHI